MITCERGSVALTIRWTVLTTTRGQSLNVDSTRLSQSLESSSQGDLTELRFQSSFDRGATVSSTSFTVSSEARETTFAGHTFTVPAGAVKNAMEFVGPPPFSSLGAGEQVIIQFGLNLDTNSLDDDGNALVVSSSSSPVRFVSLLSAQQQQLLSSF
jgi:hypothetical protein